MSSSRNGGLHADVQGNTGNYTQPRRAVSSARTPARGRAPFSPPFPPSAGRMSGAGGGGREEGRGAVAAERSRLRGGPAAGRAGPGWAGPGADGSERGAEGRLRGRGDEGPAGRPAGV